ncbi:hypothetical protein GOP47_0016825 [Adiantum capillus-veneris]|uniref:ATP synthase subunit d, mitochondrial n=1 Tax=Adiantum capillus-veneris TaxID=13818 RepID=A0A9D4UIG6_ADICA|nr:hypothetical protein GOP47_0016825 [Adiantum capillus-veneris]
MSSKTVAQQVLKDLDWDKLAKAVVSDEGRRELNNLRRAFDDFNNVMRTKFSLKPKPIDWEFYRKRLNPGIVDMFQKSYETLKIPKYEDTVTPEYKKKFDALMVKVTDQEEVSRKRIEECKANLKRLKEEKESLQTMTANEYFAKHPEVKAKFDEEIKNHNWGY